ncbi:uncharacterized protein N0V89_001364 [Didymosphaeria variabile]|uniref:Retrovirus-related Pol polyprotein from transposon TNT 1-94-like beta-barrel domain-containing protein n=1 Tax=Didymosphaeria variabile TaxID=1932322 RepID=A0A9W9CGM9_9PLEO|nr:uncharacterized protein N0V89_001364 [Didymosphaeria variabile]KAJ4360797.1 hypothetical protein N0V89_001364 [Didymosphaeria variabile]
MASSSNNQLCPDWVFLNLSNVHVAKDRDWFTSYTPFESTLASLYGGSNMRILGIGTVHIPVKQTPNSTSTTLWRLEDVLHVPDFVCNALGAPLVDKYGYTFIWGGDKTSKGTIRNDLDQQIAYFLAKRPLYVLAIEAPEGKQLGPPVIVEGKNWMINCRWEDTERKKWEDYRDAQKNEAVDAREDGVNSGYTDAEKDFAKQHWGSEYKFLTVHGLSIYKEEDREQGRIILRTLISNEE